MYYKYRPKENDEPYAICNTLYGTRTYYYKCIGYCTRKGKYLTTKQLKGKGCLGKQCPHLVKIEDRTFWKRKQKLKENKQSAKVLTTELNA